jgi:transcriptional regulator with XRE-family HTH domain
MQPDLPDSLKIAALGETLREFRQAAGYSVDEFASLIQKEPAEYEAYERNADYPSLIELETLAYYLNILPESFWITEEQPHAASEDKPRVNYSAIANVRRRSIGLQLRKQRIEAGFELEEFAALAGVTPEILNAYELGEQIPSIAFLVHAAELCKRSIQDYLDRKSPVGVWAERQRIEKELANLPDEIKSFVAKPINRPFIELAKKLSEMPVQQLRQIAEGILEITL